MSNLPPGCESGTFGAPWNDEEIEHNISLSIEFEDLFAVNGPLNDNGKEDCKVDRMEEIKNKIKDLIDQEFETDCNIE